MLLEPREFCIPGRVFPIPPAPAVFDQRVIDVGAIGQTHIGKGTSKLVAAVRLEEDFFPKHHRGGRLLGLMAVGLALLRAVDAAQADAFRVSGVEDFEGIAVEDPDDEAREVSHGSGRAEQEQERAESKDRCSSPPPEWKRDNKTPVR
jgi:hypothetical protein